MTVLAGVTLTLAGSGSRAAGESRAHVVAPEVATYAASASGGLTAQPTLGFPASFAQMIGASPGEAPGELWAQGALGDVPSTVGAQTIADAEVLVRRTAASGAWQIVPVDDASGNLIAHQWTASEVTPGGGVALDAPLDASGDAVAPLITRDPGGAFALAPAVPGPDLDGSETLTSAAPTMATVDGSGHTEVFLAPQDEDQSTPGVLNYVGGAWSREPICESDGGGTCSPPSTGLAVDALAASSPTNAYLIATPVGGGAPQLFARQSGGPGGPAWVALAVTTPLLTGTTLGQSTLELPDAANPTDSGAVLTPTAQGVWVDVDLASGGATPDGSATVLLSPSGTTIDTWCYSPSSPGDCPAGAGSLGGVLPAGYGSTTFAGTGAGDPGTRIITGLPNGALLRLSEGGTAFQYEITAGQPTEAAEDAGGNTVGPGGETITNPSFGGGAAFDSPTDGWIGTADPTPDVQVEQLTENPTPTALTAWPLPFRYPLLAVASAPGEDGPGATGRVLAVGVNGQVGLFTPGEGWAAQPLLNGSGTVQTPTLRAVAWPEPGRAYAVGDGGAMWLYQSSTGLWEPDPAAPLNFQGDLTGIAFSPTDPELGYAVGKQGVLLAYGKTWTQQALPAGLDDANFSSVAFAGDEALVAYRTLATDKNGNPYEQGGVMVNGGSGWEVDPSAAQLLATLPPQDSVITKVAGLPDGGAVAAGPGIVIERDSASAPWRFSATPLGDFSASALGSAGDGGIAALAAYRDGASVRAFVSLDPNLYSNPNSQGLDAQLYQNADDPPAVAVGQPPLLLNPDPIPDQGFLLKETASGWTDAELGDYPGDVDASSDTATGDQPGYPDAVLGLLTSADGTAGWAVGGLTGGADGQLFLQGTALSGVQLDAQTSSAAHFGPGPAPPQAATTPVSLPAGDASFAFGGAYGCVAPCADDAEQNLNVNAGVTNAIAEAGRIAGLRAFVYTGRYVGGWNPGSVSADAFERELAQYDQVLSSGGGLPVYAVATSSDIDPAGGIGAAGLAASLGVHMPAGTSPGGAPPVGTAAYAFDSTGAGAAVRMIVLDYSANALGAVQLGWLSAQLASAKAAEEPAIVVGGDSLTDPAAPNYAADAAAVGQALVAGGASAYVFFDAAGTALQGANVRESIGAGPGAVPAYGTGTLGYTSDPLNPADDLSASGMLLLSVNPGARAADNQAPVTVSLVPNVGQLAIDAVDGTLLPRSQPALFQGLARRPFGGTVDLGGTGGRLPQAYTTLPQSCTGANCGEFIQPEYAFSSSNPQVGTFVKQDPSSSNPRQVALSANGQPIPDASSGLFCAFNPGTTTVSISSGGLSYSEAVTVRGGSVREPCGTVPVTEQVGAAKTRPPVLPVQPQPVRGHGPKLNKLPPPPPPPVPKPVKQVHPARVTPITPITPVAPRPVVVHHRPAPPPPARHHAPPPIRPVLGTTPPTALPPRPAFPPAPGIARPIPPAGFGTVSSSVPLNVRAVERQREEEPEVEAARNSFFAYHPDDHSRAVFPLALLVLVLGGGGAGSVALMVRRGRRGRPRGGAALARSEVRPSRYRRG